MQTFFRAKRNYTCILIRCFMFWRLSHDSLPSTFSPLCKDKAKISPLKYRWKMSRLFHGLPNQGTFILLLVLRVIEPVSLNSNYKNFRLFSLQVMHTLVGIYSLLRRGARYKWTQSRFFGICQKSKEICHKLNND